VGQLAVEAGSSLTASELALLAALGRTHVRVGQRPRVALLSTGDELVELGSVGPGQVVDSNAIALGARLVQLGCDPVFLGVAPDSQDAITERLQTAQGCDVVLSSAGVSVGERDFVRSALDALRTTVHLEGVAIRPGKPLVFATGGRALYFGLPGNPVSSRVTFEVFVRPAIRKLQGLSRPELRLPARLEGDFRKRAELTFFPRVRLERRGLELWATPMPKQSSGYLTSLVGADGLAILPAGPSEVAAGTVVDVLPF
jgi:molybdopterin molybdotransferase